MKLFDVLSINETYKEIIDRIIDSNPFAWTRWGDGELMYMNGEYNKTDHLKNIRLQDELKEAFQINDKNFMISLGAGYESEGGMEPGVFAPFGNDNHLIDIVNKMGVRNIYPNFILFHYLLVYQTDVFKMFFRDFISPKNIMFVSGQPKESIEKIIGNNVRHYIKTPIHNAYESIDSIYKSVEESSSNVDIIFFACGMDSNVLQKRLWENNVQVQTIDLGSVIDVFSGDMKRTWVRKTRDRILNNYYE